MHMDDPLSLAESDPAAASLSSAETVDGWELLLYCARADVEKYLSIIRRLAPSAQTPAQWEALPADADWVTISQSGLDPIDIGPFHIHTGDRSGEDAPGQWPIRIDAGLAFGTGQHATTSGCIEMAISVHKGFEKHNILDIGTGAGVLAICARRLFPVAQITASDIDPIATEVAAENARINGVETDNKDGAILFLTAAGTDHPQIAARGPYDLVFANILAAPLIQLAADICQTVGPDGHLILAGLLQEQAADVAAAYAQQGLHLLQQADRAEWSILQLNRPQA